MNNRHTHLFLKPWVRITLMIILAFLLCLSVFLIFKGNNPTNVNDIKYSYTTDSDAKYKVYLKENDYFEDKYLDMDKQYPTQLIDYIDIDFYYLLSGSLKADFDYQYDVDATIIGEYENTSSGKSELWNKKYVIIEPQQKQVIDSTVFNVTKNVKLNYGKYNKIVDNFKQDFKLAIDAYLRVNLKVKYEGKIKGVNKNVRGEDVITLDIPLNSSTMKITKNFKNHKQYNLTKQDLIKKDKDLMQKGIILLIISIVLFIFLSPKIFISNKNYYIKTYNKLVKTYNEILVEVEEMIDFDGYNLIEIKNFDDLVDVEEEIKSPILYKEMIPSKETWFVIVYNEYIYRYILRK